MHGTERSRARVSPELRARLWLAWLWLAWSPLGTFYLLKNLGIRLCSVTPTKDRPDSQYEDEEKRRTPAVRARRGCSDLAVRLSQAKFAQAKSRDAPPSRAPVPARPWTVSGHPPALEPRAKQRVRGAEQLSLCAKGVS